MPIKIDPDAFYSDEEVAGFRGLKPESQVRERSLGSPIPYSKLGNLVVYRGADIIATLEKNRVQHGAQYKALREGDEVRGGANA